MSVVFMDGATQIGDLLGVTLNTRAIFGYCTVCDRQSLARKKKEEEKDEKKEGKKERTRCEKVEPVSKREGVCVVLEWAKKRGKSGGQRS